MAWVFRYTCSNPVHGDPITWDVPHAVRMAENAGYIRWLADPNLEGAVEPSWSKCPDCALIEYLEVETTEVE